MSIDEFLQLIAQFPVTGDTGLDLGSCPDEFPDGSDHVGEPLLRHEPPDSEHSQPAPECLPGRTELEAIQF